LKTFGSATARPKTTEAHVYHVRELAYHFKRSPERFGDGEIHRYLLYLLRDKRVPWTAYRA
jgi:hypothetical protein